MVRDLSTDNDIGSPDVAHELASHGVTADVVLNRVVERLSLKTDTDLARVLGVSKTTISTWRRRNKIPYENLLVLHYRGVVDFVYAILGVSLDNHLDNLLVVEEAEAEQQAEFFRKVRLGMERLKKQRKDPM